MNQYFTVIKIGGVAASEVRTQFQQWQKARTVEDPHEWAPEQWPEDSRHEIDSLVDRIREHAHEPPVVFFAEYVDMWSMSFNFSYPFPLVMGDRYELTLVDLPLSQDVTRQLKKERNATFSENRFFAKMILEARDAWEKVVDESTLLIVRRVVGGLVLDHELEATLASVPKWIQNDLDRKA